MRGRARKWRISKWAALAAAGLAAVWIAAAPYLADLMIVDAPLEKADAIVVLSGSADHLQRAAGAAEAFRRGAAGIILLTNDDQRGGWDDTTKGNPYFIDRTAAELIRQGIPPEAIVKLSKTVYGTDEEAEVLIDAAHGSGYRSLLIVTSDYHSRRAVWTFRRAVERKEAGLAVGLFRCPPGAGYPHRWTWWLTPRGWRTVGAEYVKFAYYWLY